MGKKNKNFYWLAKVKNQIKALNSAKEKKRSLKRRKKRGFIPRILKPLNLKFSLFLNCSLRFVADVGLLLAFCTNIILCYKSL